MAKWYTDAPEIKFPNLFFEVSNLLQITLDEYKIEYTKTDIFLLRGKVLESLCSEGINQENYNPENHQSAQLGTIIHEIDVLYKTNYSITNSIEKSFHNSKTLPK